MHSSAQSKEVARKIAAAEFYLQGVGRRGGGSREEGEGTLGVWGGVGGGSCCVGIS